MNVTVTYTERAKQRKDMLPLLEKAADRLAEIVDPSHDAVRAEWDRIEDARARHVYLLRVSEGPDFASCIFEPQELESWNTVHGRLVRLWGDLLQARSHRLLKELMA